MSDTVTGEELRPTDCALGPPSVRNPGPEEEWEATERRGHSQAQGLTNSVNSADGRVRRGWRTGHWITDH